MLLKTRILALGIVIAAMPVGVWGQPSPGVDVSYALVKADLSVGEPVFLRFSVTNRLSEDIIVDDRVNFNGYGGFRATIIRPDGRVVDAPKQRPVEAGLGHPRSLRPTESSSTLILVNKWVDFDLEGRYVLDVETTHPLVTASGVKLSYPTDGHVTIDVGPRDPARLEKICAGLWSELTRDPSAPGALELKETLGYIKDPVVVQYLARIPVGDKGMEEWEIWALERVGDGPAVDVLMANANGPSQDSRISVRRSLEAIEKSTSDSTIKEKIRASFQQK
jgi:hypothetical protein